MHRGGRGEHPEETFKFRMVFNHDSIDLYKRSKRTPYSSDWQLWAQPKIWSSNDDDWGKFVVMKVGSKEVEKFNILVKLLVKTFQ